KLSGSAARLRATPQNRCERTRPRPPGVAMPFFPATHATEHKSLIEWVDAALVNARSTVHGLTIEHLRARPVPTSELTLGGRELPAGGLMPRLAGAAVQWPARAAAGPAGVGTAETALAR